MHLSRKISVLRRCNSLHVDRFLDEESPRRAIRRYDGYVLPNGNELHVGYPKNRIGDSQHHSDLARSTNHARAYSQQSNSVNSDQLPVLRPASHGRPLSSHQFYGPLRPARSSLEPHQSNEPLTVGFQAQLDPVTGPATRGHGSVPSSFPSIPEQFVEATVSQVLQHRSAMDRLSQHKPGGVSERNAQSSSKREVSRIETPLDIQPDPRNSKRGSSARRSQKQRPKNDEKENCPPKES